MANLVFHSPLKGSWLLQDGALSYNDFVGYFEEYEIQVEFKIED